MTIFFVNMLGGFVFFAELCRHYGKPNKIGYDRERGRNTRKDAAFNGFAESREASNNN